MGSDPDIIEISSDEDDFDLDKLVDASHCWFSGWFDHMDGETEDVMVVDEFSTPTAVQKQDFASLKRKRGVPAADSDDDCLVLDADPDNPFSVVDGKTDGGDGLDDLLIVGEKGQLACRDLPHSRHNCVNFPFNTTPHEKHCDKCHCYVCDSPAPCIYWSKDVSSADHCHSTDTEGKWKALRKSFRQRSTAAPQPLKPPDTTRSMFPPLRNPASIHRSNPLPTLSSKSRTLRPCTAANVATRNTINQGHQQRPPAITYRGPWLSQHPTKSQPFIPGTQYVQREKRGPSALAAQIVQSHAKLRRVGTTGNSLISNNTNRPHHGVSNHNQVYRPPPPRSECPLEALVEENMKKWQDILQGVAVELGVSDSINKSSSATVQPHTVSSQPSAFSPHLSPTNASQDVDAFVHSAPPRTNPDPLDFDCSWLNNSNNTTAQNIAEYGWAPEDPQTVTLQPSDPSVLSSVGLEPLAEAGKEIGISELDPAALLCDFDDPWSSVAQL